MLGASEPWQASSSSSSPPSTFGSCAAATATEGSRSEASRRLRWDRCDSRHGIRPFATVAEKPLHASVRTHRRQRSGLQAVAVGAGGRSISHLRCLWTKLPWMRNPPNADDSGKVRATLTRRASAWDSTKPVAGNFSSQELDSAIPSIRRDQVKRRGGRAKPQIDRGRHRHLSGAVDGFLDRVIGRVKKLVIASGHSANADCEWVDAHDDQVANARTRRSHCWTWNLRDLGMPSPSRDVFSKKSRTAPLTFKEQTTESQVAVRKTVTRAFQKSCDKQLDSDE